MAARATLPDKPSIRWRPAAPAPNPCRMARKQPKRFHGRSGRASERIGASMRRFPEPMRWMRQVLGGAMAGPTAGFTILPQNVMYAVHRLQSCHQSAWPPEFQGL